MSEASALRDAAPLLRRPFHPALVQFKAEAWEADNSSVVAVPYIDRAAVIERLNFVVPDLWYPKYGSAGKEGLLWCHLTIDGVTRSDVGEANGENSKKGLVSDALKRAAVHFGVGVSLCSVPNLRIPKDDAERVVSVGGKYRLTEAGLAVGSEEYGKWLTDSGEGTYGSVLEHKAEVEPSA